GAGTQCRLWAKHNYSVTGVDVNQPLIELARSRAAEEGLPITFKVGSATDIPIEDNAVDLCLVPELLEHVADWESCVREFARITKPGGMIFLSTTNVLCPVQQEFTLPFYSWYPSFLKRRYEKLSVTTRPELANYAKY
ncbi:MAG TPA: class I SAM-dependent methyltransferase, partial [Burkholderiales bacterium]|nr:class I SAM-dependent methyltransferase [Burkholderiales bacterium]